MSLNDGEWFVDFPQTVLSPQASERFDQTDLQSAEESDMSVLALVANAVGGLLRPRKRCARCLAGFSTVGDVSNNILMLSLVAGMTAAMPVHATVTQAPVNDVVLGSTVQYQLQPNWPAGCGTTSTCSVTFISVVDASGIDVASRMSAAGCNLDGQFYCQLAYPTGTSLSWTPQSGTYNLTFNTRIHSCLNNAAAQVCTDVVTTDTVSTVVRKATLNLQITASPAAFSKVGEQIVFIYTVGNANNVELTNLYVTSGLSTNSDGQGVISGCGPSLSAKASVSCTVTHNVTPADIAANSISVSGYASASMAIGNAATTATTSAVLLVDRTVVHRASAPGTVIDFTTLPNLTPNELSLAGALNGLCATSANAIVQTQCTNLYNLTTAQQQTALQQLVPDQVAAQGANAVETAFTQLSNIRGRLGALHNNAAGAKRFALNVLILAYNDQAVPVGTLADTSSGLGTIADTGRLGGFLNGRIQFGKSGTTANTAGYDFGTKGVTSGLDYRVTDQLVLGGALGYANSQNDYSSSRGAMTTNGATVSFYGSYYTPHDMYLDWIASYSGNKYDSRRHIAYEGLDTQSQGNTNGRQSSASLSFGADFNNGPWILTPYLRTEYVEAIVDRYAETGASGFAVSYDRQTVRSFVSAAAARVAWTIGTTSGVYTPSAHLEWEHQFLNDQRLITARFVEDPTATTFNVSTNTPDRNYFNFGLGIAATWPGGRSGFVNCESVLGQANIRNYAFDFGVRQEF